MANVKVQWSLPTTRESGNPLAVDDIDHVAVELSADGVNFAVLGTFPPNVLETVVEALDTGEFSFRGTVVDKKARRSKPYLTSITIDETAPAAAILVVSLV